MVACQLLCVSKVIFSLMAKGLIETYIWGLPKVLNMLCLALSEFTSKDEGCRISRSRLTYM